MSENTPLYIINSTMWSRIYSLLERSRWDFLGKGSTGKKAPPQKGKIPPYPGQNLKRPPIGPLPKTYKTNLPGEKRFSKSTSFPQSLKNQRPLFKTPF